MGWAVDDMDGATVRRPSRPSGGRPEPLVGICNPAIVFLLEFVDRSRRGWISPQPELLDELLAFRLTAKSTEGKTFFLGDDIERVFVEPFPKNAFLRREDGLRLWVDPFR